MKADVNIKDAMGKSPLHLACFNHLLDLKTLKLLIENKCEINAQDEKKKTPLHYCCSSNEISEEIVEYMIKNKGIEKFEFFFFLM